MAMQGYVIYFFTDAFGRRFNFLFWDNIITDPVRASSVYKSTQFISSLFSTALCGSISEQLSKKTLVYGSTILTVAGAVIIAFTRSFSLILIIAVFTGLGLGMFSAIDLSISIDSVKSKKNMSRDLAIAQLAVSIPKMIVSPVIGSIIGTFDILFEQQHKLVPVPHLGYTVIYLLAGACMLVSAVFIAFMKFTNGGEDSTPSPVKKKRTRTKIWE